MAAGPGVLARVFIRRAIAAARRTAVLTGAQMDPARTNLDALFAFLCLRSLHRRNRAEMFADVARHNLTVVVQKPMHERDSLRAKRADHHALPLAGF